MLAGAALLLHLPYRVEVRRDARRHTHARYVSALYRYEVGPGYARLTYHGMRDAQRALLGLLREAWATQRGDLLRRLVGALRRWLGL